MNSVHTSFIRSRSTLERESSAGVEEGDDVEMTTIARDPSLPPTPEDEASTSADAAGPNPAHAVTRIVDITPFGKLRGTADGNGEWKLPLDRFEIARRTEGTPGWDHLRNKTRSFYEDQNELLDDFGDAERLLFDGEAHTEQVTEMSRSLSKQVHIAAVVSLVANILLLIAKIAAVVSSGSLAVVSSLVDSSFDLLSAFVIWWTGRWIRKRNPFLYPQGKTRLEPVSIVILSAIMAVAAFQVITQSIEQLARKSADPIADTRTIVILASTVVVKFILWIYCRRINSASTHALAQDHLNDVAGNVVAIVSAVVGARYWKPMDPLGALIISIYIVVNWARTGLEHVRHLTGRSADSKLLKKLTWIAWNHDSRVLLIDTVRAFHFGINFLVEIDIVLPETMTLREAHDIGEALQNRIERVEDVERAFVHLDYEPFHNPNIEHKTI